MPTTLDNAALDYFRGVASLRTDLPPWRVWFARRQGHLVEVLGPQRCLKLKFSPQHEIPRLLRDLGLRYDRSLLPDHLSMAARGLPWSGALADRYGVNALFEGGEGTEGTRRLADHATSLSEKDDGEGLAQMVEDARLALELHHEDLALALIKAVGSLADGEGAVQQAIADARSFAEGLE